MIQKLCFVCKIPISNQLSNTHTCKKITCQAEYQYQHYEWRQEEMDYLYGISYEIKKEEEEDE